jgi:NADH-quinone oxidoreductase subunit N
MLASTAGDLVLLFVGLELVSIPTYVLLYLGRTDDASAEATAKYFYLSILASSLLLFGFSFLYGVAGSTGLVEIRDQLAAASAGGAGAELLGLLPIGLVLIFAGLGFKIAAVPFHYYAPDVYQGASHLNAGLLAVVPKIAGVAALVRLVVLAMPTIQPLGWQIALALAVLTMTLGNVCALWQTNIRRLMAYSSIAHAGYMLIALAVALASSGSRAPTYEGLGALLFYLLIYGVATAGTFAALACLSGDWEELNDVVQLSGLGRSRPWLAAALAVFMFSLAGIPPLAGFWGKLTLFTAALGAARDLGASAAAGWFLVLAVVAALNTAVAAGYYLRVVGVIYFHERAGGRAVGTDGGAGAGLAALACAVLMVVGGILHGPLLQRARDAGRAAMLSRPVAASPQPALEMTARPSRPAGVAAQLE